ncbi:hypothetical protein [Microcoleus sp. bin38.metabat.b11b12b14.051]|uniref:hypothetical protein n=1 Tax=Microcoleus sp. bin38.metabat.b11b12b14.051 TaxID=2742709 RepID=UPI0025EA232A|nr:hypothetical protein [Microcoleus sp. bin38.metabat.b11b12b14.051]
MLAIALLAKPHTQLDHSIAIIVKVKVSNARPKPDYTTNHHIHEHQHQPHPQSILLLRRPYPCHQIRRAQLIHSLKRLQRHHRRVYPQHHPSCDPWVAGMATAAQVGVEEPHKTA